MRKCLAVPVAVLCSLFGTAGCSMQTASLTSSPPYGSAVLPQALTASLLDIPIGASRLPTLFVADMYRTQILIYRMGRPPKRIGYIRNGINGVANIWLDPSGTLYAINAAGPSVLVFPPGQVSASQTYSAPCEPHCGGYSVAVDKNGIVYMGVSAAAIYEFQPGQQTPFQTITDSPNPYGLAFDHDGNLYVANAGTDVLRYTPGSTTGVPLGLQGLTQAYGLAIDSNSDLAVANYNGSATHVLLYKLGQTAPYLQTHPFSGHGYQLAFDRAGNLYAPNFNRNNVVVYKHGSAKQIQSVNKFDAPDGVAIYPPVEP